MQFSILKTPSEVDPYVATVIRVADQDRNALGFLPPSAYQAQAERGRLWVFVDGNKVYVGHLMFGGSRQALKVTQIYILRKDRRRRLATSAIDALKVHAEETQCQYVQARVAADLVANKFWERNGFVIVKQVKGGDRANRIINLRVWFVPNSGLFSATNRSDGRFVAKHKGLLRRPSYVLDTNIVIDLGRQRHGYEDVEKLVQLSMKHEIRLRRTPELRTELARGSIRRASDFAVRFAELIVPLAPMSDSEVKDYIVKLSPLVFPHRTMPSDLTPNERSDLVHLAYCIRYDQDIFVTRDGPILKHSGEVAAQWGLEVLTPYDITPPQSSFSDTVLQDEEFGQIDFSWCPASSEKEQILDAFKGELRSKIAEIAPDWLTSHDPDQSLLRVSQAGKPIGYAYVGWSASSGAWEVIISPLESQQIARLLLDAVLAGIYHRSERGRCAGVTLSLSRISVDIYAQATKSGFIPCEASDQKQSMLQLKRLLFKGVLDIRSWPKIDSLMRRFSGWRLDSRMPTYSEFVNTGACVLSERKGAVAHAYLKLAEFEGLIAPGIVLARKRPAVLIPIKPRYADQLFPELENTPQMFARLPAGLYTERAYFSKRAAWSPVKAGAIAVFYVSGSTGHGGTAVAVARVTGVAAMPEREARESYFSRGVMSLKESDTLVKVITFSNILELRRPVEFKWMKLEGIISGANLVTAQSITTEQLRKIINRGESRGGI